MAAPTGNLAFGFNQKSNLAPQIGKFGEEDDADDHSDAVINSANGQSKKLKFNESESSDFSSRPYDGVIGDSFSGKRIRKHTQRKSVDYTSTVVRYVQARMWQRDSSDRTPLQSTPAAGIDMLPAIAYSDNPSTSIATKFVHMSMNKNRCSINRVLWTPTGRRLITGSQSGEFTLWNGQSFNFEMILQAHDQAVRSMVWSHNENWMVTGDDGGSIKYWQNNLNNVKANKSAHKESVRDLSFCKTDLKFCSCSDDTTVKVWDFARCQEERSLTGHGWDVKCVDWHPTKSLLVSGGKDSLVKLWDAKSGRELCSFHGHKNVVLCVKWNQNGNWVLTSSKDQIIKLYDIRAMKELESFRGHQKDVTALAWHPFHEEYFVSGCLDGSIFHWLVGHEDPRIEITGAHESAVWDLAWHPIGYLLCSGSYDYTTKFWSRNRPGDPTLEKFSMHQTQGLFGEQHTGFPGRIPGIFPLSESTPAIPGTFSVGPGRNEGTIPGVGTAISTPIPILNPSSLPPRDQYNHHMAAPPLPPGPHPSLLAPSNHHHHHQPFQQTSLQIPQHQFSPLPLSIPPHNLPPLQPAPAHISLLNHPHLSRPPLLPLPPPAVSSSALPPPGPASIQLPVPQPPGSSLNHMNPPMPTGRFMGMNPLLNPSGLPAPPGGFQPGGMPPLPVQPNPNQVQMFQQRQMPLLPSPFQGIAQPPLPPGPPPRGAMKGGD